MLSLTLIAGVLLSAGGGAKTVVGCDGGDFVTVVHSLQTADDPTVMGTLTKEEIGKVFHANRAEIRRCYESELARSAQAVLGKVVVKFGIAANGSVFAVASGADVSFFRLGLDGPSAAPSGNAPLCLAGSVAGDAELGACLAARIKTWTFPKPKGGGVVLVTYPFLVHQSGPD